MGTNLAIDPHNLEQGVQVSSERTEKAVVTKVLQEFIACLEQCYPPRSWRDSFFR